VIDLGPAYGGLYANQDEYVAGLASNNGVFFTGLSSYLVSGATVTQYTPPANKAAGVTTPFPPSLQWSPEGATMDRAGNLYVAVSNTIVVIYNSGPASWAIFGSGSSGDNNGQFTFNADNQAYPPDEPNFGGASGVAVDTAGNMYVTDAGNNQIRKITPAGVFSTFAGSGTRAEKDGTGTNASFSEPTYITIDAAGNLYVADQNSSTGEFLRKITPAGVVSTLCSQCLSEVGGIVVDPAGHNLYATEYYTSVVDLISIY
jgi:sugar lactone lactonase YvrE